MILQFHYENEEQCNELKAILVIECKKHFESFAYHCMVQSTYIEISIDDKAYFEDIEKAKDIMYKDNSYMTDFVSDVQEYLSFVPKIDVAGYH